MITAYTIEFNRYTKDGRTLEVLTNNFSNAHTLAYIDYNEDRTMAVAQVFDPFTEGERRYSLRPVAKAEAIVDRHLAKLGYVRPTETEQLGQDTPMQNKTWPTVEQLTEKIKQEVLADIEEETVWSGVTSYSELHNYVDANMYGFELYPEDPEEEEAHELWLDTSTDLMNMAMANVDQWLKEGRKN